MAVDPGAIRGCLYRWTYVWLTNGEEFWIWPTWVGPTSLAGWRWRWGWSPGPYYFGADLNRIQSFSC